MELKIFAPASVANVGPGFDIMGFALENVGDEMIFRKITKGELRLINRLADLPAEPDKNIAGVVAKAMLEAANADFGLEIEIFKHIKPGSGLGSSAASASGTAFGVNEMLGKPFNNNELIRFAMLGEKLASGSEHADNVAPALLGSFNLIRGYTPLDVQTLNVPAKLYCTVIHPQVEVKTIDARRVMPKQIDLQTAIKQWGNVAGLITGLLKEDYQLIGRSLTDYVAEPARAKLIPKFNELKQAALQAGALGGSISGSGPSVFMLSEGKNTAENIRTAMDTVFKNSGIDYKIYVSKIGKEGAREISLS